MATNINHLNTLRENNLLQPRINNNNNRDSPKNHSFIVHVRYISNISITRHKSNILICQFSKFLKGSIDIN